MLNGRIGGGVTECTWHSYQSTVWRTHQTRYSFPWAHSRRALLNAWAHSPRAANHPKIVTIRALYLDPTHWVTIEGLIVTKFRTEYNYLSVDYCRGAWGRKLAARARASIAFRPTHSKQTAYRATFTSANV